MSLCTDRSTVNNNSQEGRVATLRCKRWACPECAPENRRRVICKARDGNPTAFLTLTWNAARPETPDEAARAMKTAWVNLRRRIARQWPGERVPFIVVFEKTKRGFPHMHILMRCRFIDQAWLSDAMRELIDAPIVDVRKIKDRKMAFFYVTKYLGKDPHSFEGCKRWWRSHDYEVEVDDYQPIMFGRSIDVIDRNFHNVKADYVNNAYLDVFEEGRGWLRWRLREMDEVAEFFGRSSASRTSAVQSTLVD